MSVKHIRDYYNQICNQREELIQELKDFEVEAQNGMIEPERLDKIRESIQPLMDNYERISFIMYLLNRPNKKEKNKKYDKQCSKSLKKLSKANSTDASIEENKNVLNNVGKIIKGEN